MTNLALVNLDDLKVLMSEQAIPNEVWGTKQVADFLRISISTCKKEAISGNIPAVKVGAEWKFSSIALFEHVVRRKLKS
ncbi:helix-turn-helix domain-containing protein [Enterococcus ureasiticus]|uniref:Excisionase n=1 Tax=Enterococcus ureasiticus TaxID=903984 RepID=A0A1E5GET3_9ENTE|nr:helix-turn-helix domain-containing protein [Enterococcus ureasiticus]OEG10750.1 excisionase [Enterococcus ureasiticus]